MPLKAVFLDVGNTLLFEQPSRFEIYAESARRRGSAVTTDEMQALMRRAHRELPREIDGAFRYTEEWFAAYIERIFHGYLGIARDELASLMREIFSRFARPETFSTFSGGRELLDVLRARGLRLGIVSNWSTRLPSLLDRLGFTQRVDFVLCSAIERLEKPDARIFERALISAGVDASEAVHAGDDIEKDFQGARDAGLDSVLVDHFKTAGAHASLTGAHASLTGAHASLTGAHASLTGAHASLEGSRVESLDELREWILRRT